MCKSKFSTFRIPLFTILTGSLLAVSCSDFSDYNDVPESKLTSGTSLWQNIINQGNLNNFATLVQKSGMDIYLKGANYLTILAPLDGTYDMQQYMNADSAKATEQFVKQHIANYGNVITGEDSIMLRTLNGKIHFIYPNGVTDAKKKEFVDFALINIPASNGIMHLLKGPLPWKPNVYEYTDSAEQCDSFKVYVKKYETHDIDEANSVMGPPDVNGKITYLDSTVVYKNSYYDNLGIRASKEDSLYTMVYLTNNAWDDATAKIKPVYTYVTDSIKYNDWANIESSKKTAVNASMAVDVAKKTIGFEKDYLNDSVYKFIMTYFLPFSMKESHNNTWLNKWLDPEKDVTTADDDTIVTTTGFRIPGGAVAIKEHSVNIQGSKVKKLSNGYARVIDKFAFNSWDTYNPCMIYRSRQRLPYYHPVTSTVETQYLSKVELLERDTLFDDLRAAGKPFIDKIVIPQLFDERFDTQMQYVKINSNSSTNPSFCVALKNARRTTYKVIMVTAPPQVEKDYEKVITKKQRFSFWIDYYDGTKQVLESKGTNMEAKSDKFTYFDLGEITFPYSYYGIDAYPTLRVQCTNPSESGTGVKQYESVIRLAGVLLIPKEAVDF